ncbi:uncharacterized protein SPSK_02809 [Sporothrix schenckii 1099-18]|uniref:Uncharacterized protein n=1 Tax=Sporothrix schenckii 1099-18 TaxID=1397361 RepID=A0A0F2MBX7_SPOSC|nr:uncharacterized protein SPSK_02809 [Sporothrix schenckii 1099-18]KJR86569.1 hypothetical protein SPSK_02809 [Sporothrix schenckii 1099-18]
MSDADNEDALSINGAHAHACAQIVALHAVFSMRCSMHCNSSDKMLVAISLYGLYGPSISSSHPSSASYLVAALRNATPARGPALVGVNRQVDRIVGRRETGCSHDDDARTPLRIRLWPWTVACRTSNVERQNVRPRDLQKRRERPTVEKNGRTGQTRR